MILVHLGQQKITFPGAKLIFPDTKNTFFRGLKHRFGDIEPEERVFFRDFPDLNYVFIPLVGELVATTNAPFSRYEKEV